MIINKQGSSLLPDLKVLWSSKSSITAAYISLPVSRGPAASSCSSSRQGQELQEQFSAEDTRLQCAWVGACLQLLCKRISLPLLEWWEISFAGKGLRHHFVTWLLAIHIHPFLWLQACECQALSGRRVSDRRIFICNNCFRLRLEPNWDGDAQGPCSGICILANYPGNSFAHGGLRTSSLERI